MLTKRCIVLALVVLSTGLLQPPAIGQTKDPFASRSVAGDPFVEPPPPAGNPVVVRFQVMDALGVPLRDAVVSVLGVRSRPRTDSEGVATWRTTDQELLSISKRGTSKVSVTIFPPKDRLMPRMFSRHSVDELLDGRVLNFRGKQGTRLQGTVIGKEDRKPIQNVRLYFTAKGYAEPTSTRFITTTDDQGQWSIVVPRMDTQVVADGIVLGYDIGNGVRYSKMVDISVESIALDVREFEINQLPAKNIVVVGENDEPISVRESRRSTNDGWTTRLWFGSRCRPLKRPMVMVAVN